jgi:hypothetical protein
VVALLWVVGTPMRIFASLVAVLLSAAVFLAVTTPHRMARLLSYRDPFADAENTGYQAVQGFYALSSGGFFGLGLGASREKWSGGLPEAHTDYVFAIIGEELGLLGTLTVVGLFAVLIYAGIRIAQNTDDPFVRLAASGVTAWLGCQAIINMGAVVGLLPITGIPLPLVSFGGSALLVTLVAIGMLLSFARLEPGRRAALAAPRRCAAGCAARARRSAPGPPSARAPAPRTSAAPRASPGAPAARPGGASAAVRRAGRRRHRRATSSPALALADALLRRDPPTVVTALGTATGLEARLVPARGYALAEIPRVPAAAPPDRRPAPCAGSRRRCRAADAGASGPWRPTWSSASAATSRCPPTWPRGDAAPPSWCTRPTPAPAWPTASARA